MKLMYTLLGAVVLVGALAHAKPEQLEIRMAPGPRFEIEDEHFDPVSPETLRAVVQSPATTISYVLLRTGPNPNDNMMDVFVREDNGRVIELHDLLPSSGSITVRGNKTFLILPGNRSILVQKEEAVPGLFGPMRETRRRTITELHPKIAVSPNGAVEVTITI